MVYPCTNRYSTEPGDWMDIKSYRFLYFTKNITKNVSAKIVKNFLNVLKNQQQDVHKSALKRAIQKAA